MSTGSHSDEETARYWPASALTSEDAFRARMYYYTSEMAVLINALDMEAANECLRKYCLAEQLCREEPLTTVFEFGLMQMNLLIADVTLVLGKRDQTYRLVESIWGMLAAGDQRRAALRMMRRGNSAVRQHCLSKLAELKWTGPLNEYDRLLSPSEIFALFRQIHRRLFWHLARYPRTGPDALQTEHNMKLKLLSVGLEVLKLAFRVHWKHEPQRVVTLIQLLNRQHRAGLACEIGHCRSHKPAHDTLWYWDYEVAKLYLARQITREDVELCDSGRRQALDKTIDPSYSRDYQMLCWDRQREMFLRACDVSPLEVVDHAS